MTTARSGIARVGAFGDDGWGTLQPQSPDGDPDPVVVPFHSTAIVDGSRSIDVGARVRYRIVAGRQGRWEATDVEALGAV